MSSGSDRFVTGGESSPRLAIKGKETNWSNSPRTSPRTKQRKPEESDAKRVHQMQAYVAWTNSQLRKLPGSKIVQDLACDMQDGVALSQLIEVVAGEKIIINLEPSSAAIMKDNVEKILHFISTRKITLHHVTARDIVTGNLKSIMRLILALAAHFKPSSVRTSVSEPRAGRRVRRTESSLSAVAAEAAAALHDVSRAAASVGTPYFGSRFRASKLLNSSPSTSSVDSNDKDTKVLSQSMSSGSSKVPLAAQTAEKVVKRGEKIRISSNGNVTSIGKSNGNVTSIGKRGKEGLDGMMTTLSNSESKKGGYSKSSVGKKRVAISYNQWKEIAEGYNIMAEDVHETRKNLLCLQEVLLNQGVDDEQSVDESEFSTLDGALLREQITILNARLDQRSSEYDELKNELNRTKEDCINLEGTKQGLQSRLSDQEEIMMKLKADLLKLSFSNQAANSDKNELQKRLEERDREIALLRSELISKDSQLEKQKKNHETALTRATDFHSIEKDLRSKIKTHEINSGALRSQVKELQQKLHSVGASEVKLSNRITYQDRKVTLLEDKLLRDHGRQKPEGVETVQQCLRRLRSSLGSHDPQHRTLDTLEETLKSIVDCGYVQFPINDVHKGALRNNNYQNGFSAQRELDETKHSDVDGATPCTRITYHSPWAVTPSVTIISKRLGEVTLGDLKSLLGRPGQFRYFFKALDPEFGTIREELVNDYDVIPGWEGKIMAWITDPERESSGYHDGSMSHRSETDI